MSRDSPFVNVDTTVSIAVTGTPQELIISQNIGGQLQVGATGALQGWQREFIS